MSRNIIELKYKNGQRYSILNNNSEPISLNVLINMVKNGIKTKEIKFEKKVRNSESTSYIFMDIGDDSTISLKYKNSEEEYFIDVIKEFDSACKIKHGLKSVNFEKFIKLAGATVGITCVLASLGSYAISEIITSDVKTEGTLPPYYNTKHITEEFKEQEIKDRQDRYNELKEKAQQTYDSLTEQEQRELLEYQTMYDIQESRNQVRK